MDYNEAYTELQDILEKLQGDNISIETLEIHIKRANTLLTQCQKKLRKVEKDIEGLMDKSES